MQFAIEKSSHVLVITHVDPDGDAIGSLTAVGQALKQLGKKVTLACDDKVPLRFRGLPLADSVKQAVPKRSTFDLAIAVDCGDESRMGEVFANLPEPRPTLINIDHHITNTNFGTFNLVTPAASSTCEMLYDLFSEIGVDITTGIAESLLTGLITDTLGFRTSNVSGNTLRAAAALVDAGGDIETFSIRSLHEKPLSTARVWQLGLNNMRLDEGVLWTTISAAELRAAGLEGNPSHSGLVNFLADVDAAHIGLLFMEMTDGTVRVGMRSRLPYDVARVAVAFGGGGHMQASGCTMPGPLEEAIPPILAACQEEVRRHEPAGA